MPLHSFLKRFLLLRPAMLLLALVLALSWSGGAASAHEERAAQATAAPQAGVAASAGTFGEFVRPATHDENGHESHRHHDNAGPHGSGHCSFACNASMLVAGQNGLPRPAVRLTRSGWDEARLAGTAFRPPKRPPRISG